MWYAVVVFLPDSLTKETTLEMPVPSQGHYGFHSFPVVDWFCVYILMSFDFPFVRLFGVLRKCIKIEFKKMYKDWDLESV
jgi:hypothetical protein